MSPGQHQSPATSSQRPSATAPHSEYGPAFPDFASTSSYHHPHTNLYHRPPAAQPVASGDMPADRSLSRLERWAVGATDSQFNALAGAIGGFTSGVVTCPLDVIKTKLQAQGGFAAVQKGRHVGHQKIYQGLVGTATVIWREEGIRGMYRGLGPIIMGYLPTWAVWFTVYNKSKVYLAQYYENTFAINFWSSIVAGGCSTIVTNPIWVIKTRLMSQTTHHSRHRFSVFPRGANTPTSRPTISAPWHYRSTLDAARKMYTTEGVLAFYSGLTPALLGLTHVAVQFPAYEYLKTKFTGQGMGAAPVDGDSRSHWFGVLSASILSKILASSATYPHEVIRTRLQTQRRPAPGSEHLQGMGVSPPAAEGSHSSGNGGANGSRSTADAGGQGHQQAQQRPELRYRGILRTARTILRDEGWRAFYAGMGTNMMRAVPAATVTMLTYEWAMREMNKARADGRRKLGSGTGEGAWSG